MDEEAAKRVTGDRNGAETACMLSVEAAFREPCTLIHAADICIDPSRSLSGIGSLEARINNLRAIPGL